MPSEKDVPTIRSGGGHDKTRTVGIENRPAAPERHIGPYRLLRELGHGGMGTVYLAARADEQFHKRVALKIIRAGADSAEVVRAFKRERQILASLDHPNIAKLLDGGTTDDGLPYLVMEYIEGEPLLAYCDSRSMPIPERLKLFQSVCSAVQYAHRNLIVHRDIKPANVLVAGDGTPRLLDFGIAKLLNPEMAGEAPTATAFIMTPEYASPEQARGERITTATDVYSLGVVLYELLTGHNPYRLASRQPLDVLRAVLEQEPESPSTAVDRTEERTARQGSQPIRLTPESVARTREASPEKLKRRLRGDLDNILMMALCKEPQRRYASIDAFSDDIRRYLDGLPVRARKPTVGYRAGKFVRRHVMGVAAAIAAVVLLVSFVVAMAAQAARVARERDLAEKERATAQRERETAQRVSAFLVDLFKVSDPSEARGNTVTAREVLDKGAEKIATELKEQSEVRATLMHTIGKVYLSLGLFDKAFPLLQDAVETRRALFGSDHPDVAASLNDLADVLARRGDYGGAQALHREVLDIRRKRFGNDHPEVAKSLGNLARVLHQKGDDTEAERLHREALRTWRTLGGDRPELARSLASLANVLRRKGNYAGAEPLYREALGVNRKLFGNEHRDVANTSNNLATLFVQQAKYAEAEALFRDVVAVSRKLLGKEHPDVAVAMNNLATVLMEQGEYDEAESLSREALAMQRKRLGNEHPQVAGRLVTLAETLCREQKPAEAAPLAREARAIFRNVLPSGHPLIAEAESVLGGCLTLLKRYREAEPLLLGSYAVLRTKTGARSLETRKTAREIVALYEAWDKPEKANQYRGELAAEGPGAKR